jgi:hypothetical protein
VTLGPTIHNNAMDRRYYVRAGRPTKLLIPGSRLWRSATVTLGAQRADRLVVLPNMDGIIAEFDCVELPYAAFDPGSDGDAVSAAGDPTASVPWSASVPESAPETESSPVRTAAGLAEPGVGMPPEFDHTGNGGGAPHCNPSLPALRGFGPALAVRPTRLRVWTSEGVAQAKRRLCVIYDPAAALKTDGPEVCAPVAAGTP